MRAGKLGGEYLAPHNPFAFGLMGRKSSQAYSRRMREWQFYVFGGCKLIGIGRATCGTRRID